MKPKSEYAFKFSVSSRAQGEIKVMCRQRGLRQISQLLLEKLKPSGYEVAPGITQHIADSYYDSDDAAVAANNSYLRVRRCGSSVRLTFKQHFGPAGEHLIRIKNAREITEANADILNASGTLPLVSRLAPELGRCFLGVCLIARIDQVRFGLKRGTQEFLITLDIFRFLEPVTKLESDEFLEFEIQGVNKDGKAAVKSLVTDFFGAFHDFFQGLRPSYVTKYQQGRLFLEEIRNRAFISELLVGGDSLAFVIMRFGDPFLDSAYEGAIRPTFEKAGYMPIRIDEVQNAGRITDQVLLAIRKAKVILADLTGERPNCYYECGYAHALGKDVILTIRKGEEVHFDLKDHRFIIWQTEADLRRELGRRLEVASHSRRP